MRQIEIHSMQVIYIGINMHDIHMYNYYVLSIYTHKKENHTFLHAKINQSKNNTINFRTN